MEPTVPERRLGEFRIVEIAVGHHGGLHPDMSHLAGGEDFVIVSEHLDLRRRQDRADRRLVAIEHGGRAVGDHSRLAGAVPDVQIGGDPRLDRPPQRTRGQAAGRHHPQARIDPVIHGQPDDEILELPGGQGDQIGRQRPEIGGPDQALASEHRPALDEGRQRDGEADPGLRHEHGQRARLGRQAVVEEVGDAALGHASGPQHLLRRTGGARGQVEADGIVG